MRKQTWLGVCGAMFAGLVGHASARAQEPVGEIGAAGYYPASGYGVQLMLGGGYGEFTGDNARDLTEGAGTWSLRGVFGSRMPVGFEAAYTGSAQNFEGDIAGEDAYLLSTGFEGSLRLSAPITFDNWMIAPFGTAGVGWTYYSLQSGTSSALVASNDNTFTIPLAAGVGAVYRGFLFDARLTYRPSLDDDMLRDADLSTWGISGNIGVEF
jgi:hypothetical protein